MMTDAGQAELIDKTLLMVGLDLPLKVEGGFSKVTLYR